MLVRGAALMKVEDTAAGSQLCRALSAAAEREWSWPATSPPRMWWKLCVNSVGALNALALKPSGVLRGESMHRAGACDSGRVRGRGTRRRARSWMTSIGEEVMDLYATHPVDSVNSLLADRLAGRRMEWDARTGAIVRKGDKHGIETPLNRMAATLLKAIERNPA